MKKILKYFKSPGTVSKLLIVLIGILFYMLLKNLAAIYGWVAQAISVFATVIWGGVIAYLLNPIVRFCDQKIFCKMKNRRAGHTLGVILTFVVVLAAVALLFVAIIPQLVESGKLLITNLQGYFDSFKSLLASWQERFDFLDLDIDALVGSWSDLFTKATDWVSENIEGIINTSYKVGSGVFNVVIAIVFAIYIEIDKENLKRGFRRLCVAWFEPQSVLHINSLLRRGNRICMAFFGGNLLDALLIAVVNFLFMVIFGMPYPLLISAIVGITNLIPTFGPFIGAVPSLLIIILVEPIYALWFLIWTIVLQQVDGNVIKPLLFGNTTGLRPFWVLFAIVIGGKLFGVVGMLLGIPVFAMLSYLVEDRLTVRLAKRGLDREGNPLPEGVEADPYIVGEELDAPVKAEIKLPKILRNMRKNKKKDADGGADAPKSPDQAVDGAAQPPKTAKKKAKK